jgi:hypothetical protein
METKELITPKGKNKVKIKAYITGKDSKEINGVLFEGMEISAIDQKLSGSQLIKMNDKSLELVLVDIDGKTENLRDVAEEMHAEDYNYILQEVQKVTNYQDVDKKK